VPPPVALAVVAEPLLGVAVDDTCVPSEAAETALVTPKWRNFETTTHRIFSREIFAKLTARQDQFSPDLLYQRRQWRRRRLTGLYPGQRRHHRTS